MRRAAGIQFVQRQRRRRSPFDSVEDENDGWVVGRRPGNSRSFSEVRPSC